MIFFKIYFYFNVYFVKYKLQTYNYIYYKMLKMKKELLRKQQEKVEWTDVY